MKHKIAYIMSHFPHLPNTFVLREVVEMERLGWQIALYPLAKQETTSQQLASQQLPLATKTIFKVNLSTLLDNPLRYLSLLLQIMGKNLGHFYHFIQALTLFPKAVYAATLMQKEGISHIHAYFATQPALVAWIIHKLTGINYSVAVHAPDTFGKTSMLATKLNDATFVAAISKSNRQHLAKAIGSWVNDKTYVIHNGIIPENYRRQTQHLRLGKQFEILSIGSLQRGQGHRYLIEACVSLRERNIPFHCQIVGEGAERPFLEQLIASHQLEKQVKLLGDKGRSEVSRLLTTAHCYVQPNTVSQGITLSLMEAIASGLPVVATDVIGIGELIRHRETGYLMPPKNGLALAEAIEVLYAIPRHGEALAKNGRKLLLKEFELRKNVQNLSDLLEQVIEKNTTKILAN
ncbi:MAG: glycosyltransferase [Chloroflexota bacterium]